MVLSDPSQPSPWGTVLMDKASCFRPSFQAASSCAMRLGTMEAGRNSMWRVVLAMG